MRPMRAETPQIRAANECEAFSSIAPLDTLTVPRCEG